MATTVTVKLADKANTEDEERITYRIGTPDDVMFYSRNGILYASWWSKDYQVIEVPAILLVSIE